MSLQAIRLPLPAATSPALSPADADIIRLTTLWRAVARRWLSADAHRLDSAPALARALGSIEEAIASRHPRAWTVLGPAMAEAPLRWEHASTGPVAGCLTCRRIALDLPDLPLPAGTGGTR